MLCCADPPFDLLCYMSFHAVLQGCCYVVLCPLMCHVALILSCVCTAFDLLLSFCVELLLLICCDTLLLCCDALLLCCDTNSHMCSRHLDLFIRSSQKYQTPAAPY